MTEEMDSDIRISCDTHGETAAAFVCRHLLEGERRGFRWYADPEKPDAECPDAWCDACEKALEEAEEWTDELTKNMKVVCAYCYSDIRAKNWIQDDAAYGRLVSDARAYLEDRQDSFMRDFRIRDYERWDYDQETAQLIFSNDGKPGVYCDVAFVGSIATGSESWMWAWANESLLEGVKSRSREIRAYGDEHRFERLAGAYWSARPEDGWEMANIMAYLLNAIGAYRTPDENGFLHMVVLRATFAQ